MMAAWADSFITSPSEPVSSSLPLPSTTATSACKISPPTEVQARPLTTPTEVLLLHLVVLIFLRAKHLFHHFGADVAALALAGDDHLGALAAQRSDLPLQGAHARLADIVVDQVVQRLVIDAAVAAVEAVTLNLFWRQVALCDLELFLAGIAGQLDDLHAVIQRSRDAGKDRWPLRRKGRGSGRAESPDSGHGTQSSAPSPAPPAAPRTGRPCNRCPVCRSRPAASADSCCPLVSVKLTMRPGIAPM